MREIEGRRRLASRIERFHGVGLERVMAEIEYLRDDGDTVIAGGSLAHGLGNGLSDLDMLVSSPAAVKSSRVPLEHFLGSLRVDVWKLGQGAIEASFGRAEEALASERPLLGRFGDSDHEDEFKLLHRIAFGLVLDGDGLELEGQGRDWRGVASGLVLREYAERMRAAALVAQLALRAGRPIAAAVNARLAVESALNAALTARGFPFVSDKWLGERLGDAIGLADLYEPFRRLPADPAGEGAGFADAALVACAELWELDLGFEAVVPLARWRRSEELRLASAGGEQLLLAPRSGAVWALEQGEAGAWRRLEAEAGEQGWALAGRDPEETTLCVRLFELGLLGLGWTEGVPAAALGAGREVGA
ncbi:MAG TPA: hypothetical protein VG816_03670 [Solirubrobacterales bacterium]|nr:hypothetical protein [Solirubrobacterales bacterium]